MQFLKELNVAFAKKDIAFIAEHFSEDVHWHIVNDINIQGKEKVISYLENKMTSNIVEMELLSIISHGNKGAANGIIKTDNKVTYSFCNMYNFVSAGKKTIKGITSYVIKMNQS
ncbi:nuclear transport factor 2 family protein [Lysinibacillus halotolerans]